MGLLKLLPKSILGLRGQTPMIPIGATVGSKLHNTYSINGTPNQTNKPSPSGLDLNGQTPNQYLNNLPG